MSAEFLKLSQDVAEAAKELAAKNATIATLKADNAVLASQVSDLAAQLAAATGGTPAADIAALDAELAPALDPAPAPEAPPEPAPAA